jgi:hypothetical protein
VIMSPRKGVIMLRAGVGRGRGVIMWIVMIRTSSIVIMMPMY